MTKKYEVEHGEAIPYRELPPALRGLTLTKIWFDEVDVSPIDNSQDNKVNEGGLDKWKEQKALVFVHEIEFRGAVDYAALLLTGTQGVKEEIRDISRDAVDHSGLDKVYPRTQGLWIFEGDLVYHNGYDEHPEWQGHFRSMNAQDFKDLGV